MDEVYKHLRHGELIALLEKTQKENEELKKQVQELSGALAQREIQIERAGSIAEASLALNEVFASAQSAAEGYLDALRASVFRSETMERTARERAQAIMEQAQVEKEEILSKARERADRIREEALRVRKEIFEQTAKELLLRQKESEKDFFTKE